MFYRLPLLLLAAAACFAADLKLGFIGTDTSHVIAFTKVLNDPASADHIAGARMVAFFKGGSPDVDSSANRIEGFAKELQEKWKLDKPLASTLEDAREIASVLRKANVKWFTTSSLRYGEVAVDMKFPDMTGVTVWGPGPTEPHHHLSLSWYGIHAVEVLFTLLGPGAETVSMVSTADSDEVTATWKGGKIGTVRAIRPYSDFGGVVFRAKSVVQSPAKPKSSYVPMLKEIVKFFQTGVVPVPNEETMEIFAFMDAAERSKASSGAPMKLR